MKDKIFKITTLTPYPEEDIIEFLTLTNLNIDEVAERLNLYCKCGISNLKDVIILMKLGHYIS